MNQSWQGLCYLQTRQQLSAAEAELGAAGSREKALLNGGSEAARQHAKLQQSCAHLQQQLSVSCLQAQELVRALAVAGGTTARCIAATGKVATRLQRGQSQQVGHGVKPEVTAAAAQHVRTLSTAGCRNKVEW